MLASIKNAALVSYLVVVVMTLAATGASAQQAAPAPVQPATCFPGQDCPHTQTPPKERKINTGKKQCGWSTVNGKKEPLFDCGGTK